MADSVSPVAVIGLGGRFPGKATNPLKLWEMCSKGEDAWTELPSTRFNPKAFYHPDQARDGATNVKGGFFLQEDLARFDAPFFGMTKAEAASLDPQQRLLLEATYEALENAGIPLDQVSGSDMGVFVGSFCFDWAKVTLRDPDALPLYHATGSGQAMLANRVSYFFNMHGPSVTMDTACSSSLVALHQASQALRAGECSAAVVAGVNCLLCQDSLGSMSTMGFLSPDGRSYTYDSRANGYGRGEGVAVLVLKRLDRALADGDAVRAVVRNSAVNQDGRTPGITFPSGMAQAALIRRVYAQAGLDPADTTYLEAHGTGTQAGDPIEARALHETFGASRAAAGRPPLVVGCLKTNIGHLEGAAGAAGLVKTILMLEREAILPNAGFREANKKIPLAEWHLEVPTSLRPWRSAHLPVLRASVNGFGYGGTNAHVILENAGDYLRLRGMASSFATFRHGHSLSLVSNISAGSSGSDARMSSAASSTSSPPLSPIEDTKATLATIEPAAIPALQPAAAQSPVILTPSSSTASIAPQARLNVPRLFALTANDEASGRAQAAQLAAYLEGAESANAAAVPQLLEDLAFTLATRRSGLAWKAAVAADSGATLRAELTAVRFAQTTTGRAVRAGWVFTGQGAQWWGMGRELARTSAAFRASLDRSAAVLASSTVRADWSLEEELLQRDAATSRVNEPAVSQPLCTIVQVALIDMLRAWGAAPAAVVGHSSGEIGAAYAAGLLSHEAAVAAAYFRVPLDSEAAQSCRGGMMAVACSEDETLALLANLQRGGRAVIACYNSPQSFTVSGDDAAIDELGDVCTARGIRHRKLVVAFAYHSHRMNAAAADYRRLLLANRTVVEAFGGSQTADGTPQPPAAMFSSVTGAKLADGALTLDYWVDNLVNPVRFTEALTALCKDPAGAAGRVPAVDVLVEVGPHAALAGPIRQILQADGALGAKVGVLGILRRNQDATETSQALAAALFGRGVPIDLAAVNRDAAMSPQGASGSVLQTATLLTDLPVYAWNHATAYWGEARESWRYRMREHGRHDLLGAPVRFGHPLEPRWRQWIRTAETPWVRDHRVQGLVVYPAAGYLSMAIEAARQTAAATAQGRTIAGFELRDVSLGQALIVPDDTGEAEAHISLRPVGENSQDSSVVWHEFFVYSCSGSSYSTSSPMGTPVVDSWSEHCRGQIAVRWKKSGQSGQSGQSEADTEDTVTDMDALRTERARLDAAARAETEALCTDEVDLAGLYAHCTAIGLEYGPTFANLTRARAGHVAADDSRRVAGTVTVPDVAAVMPAHYQDPLVVHPGTLDACLHGIMAFRELLQAAIMPVYFGHMYVAAELEHKTAGAELGVFLHIQRSGFRNLHIDLTGWGADADATAPLIRMEGLRMTSLGGSMSGNGSGSGSQPAKTYFHTAWKPDPSLLTGPQFDALCAHLMPAAAENELLRRLDQASFYMADGALAQIPDDRVATLNAKGRKLYKSLARQRDAVLGLQADEAAGTSAEAVAARPVHVDDMASWPNATPAARAALLVELGRTAVAEGPLLAAVAASMHRIVLGEADPLEVTMQGDVLGRYYALNPRMARQYKQAAVFVDLLAHKNPGLRILEIGAGTGGATLPLLEALGQPDGAFAGAVPRFDRYDVTDISSGFFEQVRSKARPWLSRLHFARLDVERPPAAQGFVPGTYDLVVAANVLHATRNIGRTVAHARSLLRPGGRLLLIELVLVPEQRVATAAVANLFGIFDGWWVAEEPERQDSPLLAEAQWDVVLKANGFSGLDAAVWETADVATHQGSMMLSTAVEEEETTEPTETTPDNVEAVEKSVEVETDRKPVETMEEKAKVKLAEENAEAKTGEPVETIQTDTETVDDKTADTADNKVGVETAGAVKEKPEIEEKTEVEPVEEKTDAETVEPETVKEKGVETVGQSDTEIFVENTGETVETVKEESNDKEEIKVESAEEKKIEAIEKTDTTTAETIVETADMEEKIAVKEKAGVKEKTEDEMVETSIESAEEMGVEKPAVAADEPAVIAEKKINTEEKPAVEEKINVEKTEVEPAKPVETIEEKADVKEKTDIEETGAVKEKTDIETPDTVETNLETLPKIEEKSTANNAAAETYQTVETTVEATIVATVEVDELSTEARSEETEEPTEPAEPTAEKVDETHVAIDESTIAEPQAQSPVESTIETKEAETLETIGSTEPVEEADLVDNPETAEPQTTIAASKTEPEHEATESPSRHLAVLATDSDNAWIDTLAQSFHTTVQNMDTLSIADGQTLVFFQADGATLGLQTAESMERMRRLFVRPVGAAPAKVLWVTRGAATGDSAPDFALVQGLMRTLREELGGNLVHLDLEPKESAADIAVVRQVFQQSFVDTTSPEVELACRHGMVHVPRYVEMPAVADYVAARTGRRHAVPGPVVQPGRSLKLEVGQPGLLDSLFWDDDARLADATGEAVPLGADEIEIEVRAAGVNFHDVMVAMGQIENRSLGIECAGIVQRVGAGVRGLAVGDRVAGPADGTFASTARLAAWRAQKVPAHLGLAAAAGLPIVLCTAVHALRVAQVSAGDTVLVHAAAGGLGQMLVQLCQQRGATVLATAGTAAKKRFLAERCGIPDARIFSSRDASFAEAVQQATGGRGVDVVFNVLAAELLHASWRCVAPFGRFIELGKRDLQRHGRLDMFPFLRNVTFAAVDLITLLSGRPDYGARLWAESMDMVRRGEARPPEPLTTFAMADGVAALRTMQGGRHMGKLVLVAEGEATGTTTTAASTSTDESGTTVTTTTTTTTTITTASTTRGTVMTPRLPPVRLASDASYLLVGGLGGIGRALAARMVARGARHIVLLSRGGITSAVAAAAVDSLRAAGARVLVCNCDVGDAAQLAAALHATAVAGFPAVRGAVHLGLVMESALFQHMAADAWNHSLWPKVAGTWNLHRQLPADLDFFVLLSSMVGIIGNPSQTAYGAASAFQDAFSRFRRRHGLAATTVDLGMITGIGYVAEHADVQQTLRSHGFEEIDGAECLALIEAALSVDTGRADTDDSPFCDANILTGLGLGRYTGGDVHQPSYQDPRFAHACHLARAAATSAQQTDADAAAATSETAAAALSIRARLRAADSLPAVLALLEGALRSKIVALLMLPSEDELDLLRPLSQYGLDSLIAVELRNWVASEMEATVPVLEFLGGRTVQSLSGFIARQSRLVKKSLVE